MTTAGRHVTVQVTTRGRPFWLPPGGWGNGLDAESWAAVVDVRGELAATLLLHDLRDAAVPAYAAVLRPPQPDAAHRRSSTGVHVRIWVGNDAYGRARETLLRALPVLVHLFGSGVVV